MALSRIVLWCAVLCASAVVTLAVDTRALHRRARTTPPVASAKVGQPSTKPKPVAGAEGKQQQSKPQTPKKNGATNANTQPAKSGAKVPAGMRSASSIIFLCVPSYSFSVVVSTRDCVALSAVGAVH
jgi:hypothetical protein